jgi:hypothetical protein
MTLPSTAIRNQQGQVAIKWVLNRPAKTVRIQDTKVYYVPAYKQNVAMMWVNEEHVESVLGVQEKTCNCANGVRQNAFALANEIDVNLHKCGNRHCDEEK